MKKKILVPTDFSKTSSYAYWYARELASVYNCSVELLHAYNTSYSKNTIASLMAEAGTTKTVNKQLNKFIEDYPEGEETIATKVEVSSQIAEASPISFIVNASKAEDVFMIVMGTSGAHTTIDKLLGTVSSRVSQKAECPVLLVPEGGNFRPFRSVLYASNFESAQEDKIRQLTDMANTFRSSIHFVHVKEEGETEDFSLTEEKIFGELFKKGNPAFAFSMDSLEAETVVSGLHKYAHENNVDLIVLVNRQRDFVDSVWGNSLCMKMALNIKFPLLIYHL